MATLVNRFVLEHDNFYDFTESEFQGVKYLCNGNGFNIKVVIPLLIKIAAKCSPWFPAAKLAIFFLFFLEFFK